MERNTARATQPRVANDSRIRGVVKSVKKSEGYGFVTHSATGEDYFFHRSQVVDSDVPFEGLEVDDAVEFVPSDGPKGLRALNVRTT
jgi:cold shock CspA family protein